MTYCSAANILLDSKTHQELANCNKISTVIALINSKKHEVLGKYNNILTWHGHS
jgi:hypothetical protein